MARYRIGNDMTVVWSIYDHAGAAYNLKGKEVRLYYTCERGRFEVDFEIQGTNKVVWSFLGREQKVIGDYTLSLEIIESASKRRIFKDYCNAFTLVGKSCEEAALGNPNISEDGNIVLSSKLDVYKIQPIIPTVGSNSNWFVDGVDTGKPSTGKSAYEYAKEKGYEGTESEFAESLKLAPENAEKLTELSEEIGRTTMEIQYVDDNTELIGTPVALNPTKTSNGYYDATTKKFVSDNSFIYKEYSIEEDNYYEILIVRLGVKAASIVLYADDKPIYFGLLQDGSVIKIKAKGINKIGLCGNSSYIKHYDGAKSLIEDGSISTQKIQDGSISTQKIQDGSISTQKIQDGSISTQKIQDDAVSESKVKNGSITIDKISFKDNIEGKNLFDKDAAVAGYINSNGKIDSSVTSLSTSDYIKVEEGETYCYSCSGTNEMRFVLFFDKTKQPMSGDSAFIQDVGKAIAPVGASYIRFTCQTNRLDSSQLEKGETPTLYTPYVAPKQVLNLEHMPQMDTEHIKNGAITSEKLAPDASFPSVLPAISLCGKDCAKIESASVAAGGIMQITEMPLDLKADGRIVSFSAKLNSFDSIKIGFGNGEAGSLQVLIDSNNVSIYKSGSPSFDIDKPHGLTISDFITITFSTDFFAPKLVLSSAGGLYVKDYGEFPSIESYGYPTIKLGGSTEVVNAELRATSKKFKSPIWVVGDSYTSLFDERWTKQMVKTIGITDFLILGLAGGNSAGMYSQLLKALNFGTPKFLLWCLGMNDTYSGWKATFETLQNLCKEKGIELILQTIPIPNLATSQNQYEINNAVRNSGYRYIDACAAMCPNNQYPWFEGYTDEATSVHPNVLGAKVLAARFLSDFPEFVA